MYLKQVEMRGFKSFADKTVVEFKEGVTCVVGPNGSGKSNITDAVRWVLGEQRVKTLRGNKMEDVIFSGTKHRKSLGLAEVKLTFDNSNQFFPLEYDEISIVRRVHRSGDSEYLINQMPCRLKDVRELFMDTGIGREGYSIIGQGRIDEILSNNKEERRLLFEEAAGIIKYKSRKIESEKKLKATTENLLRIQDIISEIEDRVEPLRMESERAKQYIEITEALKSIELNYYSKRYLECEQSLLDILGQLREFEDQLKAIDERHDDLKLSYNEKDGQMVALNREIRALEALYHERLNDESKTIGEKELIQEKKANTKGNIARILQELEELEDEKNRILKNIEYLIDEKAVLEEEKRIGTDALNDIQIKLDLARQNLEDKKTENDINRKDVIDKLNLIELKKQENETLERMSLSLRDKLAQIQKHIEGQKALIEQSHQDKAVIIEKLSELNVEKLSLNKSTAETIQFLEYNKKEHNDLLKQYDQTKQTLSQSQTELKLLNTLEEEFDGYDKGVKDILVSLEDQTGIIGIVASLIEVPKKYEIAIEVSLGRAIQNIVCERISDAKRSIEYLRKNDLGRVTFLPLENLDEKGQQSEQLTHVKSEKGFIGIAKDLIKVEKRYEKLAEFLLGRILIVEDFETASRMIRIKNLKYKVITLSGDILVPGGAISGGSFKSKVSNILSRKRRITELQALAAKLEIEHHQQNVALQQFSLTIADQEDALRQLRAELDRISLEIVKLEHMRDNHTQVVDASQEVNDKYEADFQTLNLELEESRAKIDENMLLIENSKGFVSEVESSLFECNTSILELEASVTDFGEAYNTLKMKMASLEQSLAFKNREINRIDEDLELHNQKIDMRKNQIVGFSDHAETFETHIESLIEKINQIKSEVAKCKEEIAEKTSIKQSEYKALDAISKEMTMLLQKHEEAKENIHKLDVKKVKLEVEKDTVTAELWEKYEMSIAEALQVEEVPYQKNEMKQLRFDLKMLGTVNIGAIKEYEEVSTRFEFLSEQKKDLLDAVQQLEKIIADLEKKMIVMFKENFDIINEHFKGTFKALFNGGDAELLLADYDDILDCDVEIIAQPPGKKLQSINLLSGGEKALTAIALLFAILSTKPTPFCILDEIEAALDDVNVFRFADFIRDYAKNSQFIIITHRKGTMEIADTLYGVTMEEYGISRVLSVQLEEIAAQLD
ncbi:MAG TPA: chromosome segregation protein SMC [Clostridiales bacterium UBA8960]|nr:chromosome segregation protein SMC [Clostridiales bacterium UBA8960]